MQSGLNVVRLQKLVSVNAYLLLISAEALELYGAVNKSEQRIIGTLAYIIAGMNMCASLSYQNGACAYLLHISALYAKSLGLGVTAVLGRTHTFFMSEIL